MIAAVAIAVAVAVRLRNRSGVPALAALVHLAVCSVEEVAEDELLFGPGLRLALPFAVDEHGIPVQLKVAPFQPGYRIGQDVLNFVAGVAPGGLAGPFRGLTPLAGARRGIRPDLAPIVFVVVPGISLTEFREIGSTIRLGGVVPLI
jgi:hypothetical protein